MDNRDVLGGGEETQKIIEINFPSNPFINTGDYLVRSLFNNVFGRC